MRIFIWICDIDIWLFFQLSMIYMEYPHFFNYNLQHISGIPPVCISCIKKKHIVNLMREIRFYCGKLWWTLIMTLISWAFRRSKSISTFFLHPVYALVPDPSWSFMDAIWRDIGLSCQAPAFYFTFHWVPPPLAPHGDENLWETGPRSWFRNSRCWQI